MKKCSVSKIESFSVLDGPGIRTVIFLNGCKLRCKFCHNPEMWNMSNNNYDTDTLTNKILRNKLYFKNGGGVTFSGGEPLLQTDAIIEICKQLKDNNIHIALDTAGIGSNYKELLKYIDLVIFDIKSYEKKSYFDLTNYQIDESLEFLDYCQKINKPMWIRQVIVPGINDNENYILGLKSFISNLKNIEKVELLPYHTMALDKYKSLNIKYALDNVPAMDIDRCNELESLLNG